MVLNACGGGGSISRDNDDNGGGTTTTLSLSLALSERDSGTANDTVSAAVPLTVSATVVNQDGAAVSGQLVTFTVNDAELASIDPASGTASTNSQGVASVTLLAGTKEGAGQITGRLSTGETATVTFTSAGDGSLGTKKITLSIASRDGNGLFNQLSASNPLTVTGIIEDADGNPVADELVTFTFTEDGYAFFNPSEGVKLTTSTTALSGADGSVSIDLLVGENPGAAKVIATTSTGEVDDVGFESAGGGSIDNQEPATLDFYTSALQLASSGSDEVELIALTKNAANVLLAGVEVSFSSNSGELLINDSVTGPDGTARAKLTSRNNPENRTITVTAESGALSQEIAIQVIGTEVKINAPSSVTLDDNAPVTIVVADSDGVGIPNQQVTLVSEVGNAISNTSPITDETGQVTVSYTANQSGRDTLTATALNASATQVIAVQEDEFTFTLKPTDDVPLRTDQDLTVTWLKNNEPYVGGEVTFYATRGTLSTTSGVTDANGQISLTVSSRSAGPAIIGATGEDSDGGIVNARAEMEFVATTVANMLLTASPNSIGPDGQKSTITAVLRDEIGNLVKGVTVNFNAANDVTGGVLFPATSTTDSNGIATTVYTSNTVTTGQDGITITATENSGGLSASTNITVADRPLFITLGTGNTIESIESGTAYLKRFSIFVTDADSNPVNNVNLTVSGTPVRYTDLLDPNADVNDPNYQVIRPAFYKGYWEAFPSLDAFEFWVSVRTLGCANEDQDGDAILDDEDSNNNGVLDPGEDIDGDGILAREDINGDGNLTPGTFGSIDGNVTTDENGQAVVDFRYPKSFAAWATVKITVSTPVAGSESRVSQYYQLSASGDDLTSPTGPPNSPPFGSGVNLVADPNNPGESIDDGSALTCTNSL